MWAVDVGLDLFVALQRAAPFIHLHINAVSTKVELAHPFGDRSLRKDDSLTSCHLPLKPKRPTIYRSCLVVGFGR